MVTMPTVSDGPNDYKAEVSRVVGLLNHALAGRDAQQVRKAAVELWKMKAQVDLLSSYDTDYGDSEADPPIGIDVTLQRRGKDCGTIRLLVPRTLTVWQLKHLMLRDYKIPVNVQRWIYRRQLLRDDVTLKSSNVKAGDVLGLYIKAPNFANEASEPPPLEILEPVQLVGPAGVGPAGAAAGNQRQRYAPVRREPQRQNMKWQCTQCTLLNEATRPSCEMCGGDRPKDFVVPADYQASASETQRMEGEAMMTNLFAQTQKKEKEAHHAYVVENLRTIAQNDDQNYVVNEESFECPVCVTEVEPGAGVVLRNCLHEFCTDCLRGTVNNSEGAEVICPFTDDDYECNQPIQQREICAVVSKDDYDKYLRRSVRIAEGQEKNSFHCITPNCQGWCIYEDAVNFFKCPICQHVNCLTCKVIHEGQNCRQYQDDLKRRAEIDVELRNTLAEVETMLTNGEAMKCPGCGVVLQKKGGCDNMTCSVCKKGFRWAPIVIRR